MSTLTPTLAPARGVHPLSGAEVAAVAAVLTATAAVGTYGFLTGAPSTVAYVVIVLGLSAGLVHLRRTRLATPLPAGLVLALAAVAVAHLTGGLVRVGDNVLYNATAGGQLGRYDHLVHSTATFLGTFTCWHLFGRASDRPELPPVVWFLVGLGLGAANETIEFLTTMAHHGSHVGGYVNTGWDLVSNLAGATAATLAIRRRAAG